MNGASWLVFAGIIIAIWCLRGSRKTIVAHVHATDDLHAAARHEGGHAAVGKHLGGRVGTARIYPDGSGYVKVHEPSRGWTPAERAAVSLGGALGEGTSIEARQCSSDKANLNAHLKRVPGKRRAAEKAEAYRLARQGLSAQSGTANSIANKLIKKGRA